MACGGCGCEGRRAGAELDPVYAYILHMLSLFGKQISVGITVDKKSLRINSLHDLVKIRKSRRLTARNDKSRKSELVRLTCKLCNICRRKTAFSGGVPLV